MKGKYMISLLALLAAVFLGGTLLLEEQPALLPNDGAPLPAETDTIVLPDDEVPLASLPDDEVPLASLPEDAADPYEGLNDTQIKYVEEVLTLVNEARAQAGAAALTLDPDLRKAAQVRAGECVGTFSHTRPNGTSYKTAITEAGIQSGYTGENVATGHTSAKQVVDRWLQSEGHRANILNENFTKIGIGLEKNTGNRYGGYAWAQLFVK